MAQEKRKLQVLDFDEKYLDEDVQGPHDFEKDSMEFGFTPHDDSEFDVLDIPLVTTGTLSPHGNAKEDPGLLLNGKKMYIPLEDVVVRNRPQPSMDWEGSVKCKHATVLVWYFLKISCL